MGTGVNGMVLSLFNDNEKYLYVGGMFLSADGQRASKVARWDGLSTEPRGPSSAKSAAVNAGVARVHDDVLQHVRLAQE